MFRLAPLPTSAVDAAAAVRNGRGGRPVVAGRSYLHDGFDGLNASIWVVVSGAESFMYVTEYTPGPLGIPVIDTPLSPSAL
ncbi:MAG: hypothetical protein ACRD1V_09810 [Vicinamibacterales bacterium]